MGIVKPPEIENYWRKDGICNITWFASIMSSKRYKDILRFLHLTDNEKAPERDSPEFKLYKLGGLHNTLNKSFNSAYSPSKELSVDEQMVGTRCRVSFIQYMPKKPTKFGIKIWVLADASTGYCLQYQIYTGKVNNTQERGLTYRVVTELLSPYLNRNHNVFFDNFFTTIPLIEYLATNGTFCCGTIRSDRGKFPQAFLKAVLEKGQSVFVRKNNLLAVHWKDKRDVYVVSSIHGNEIEEVQRRGEKELTNKPRMINQYNCFMNGVDKCDQMLASYSIQRKTTKWWKKLFFQMVELSIINSMVLYDALFPDSIPKRCKHRIFRTTLVHQLGFEENISHQAAIQKGNVARSADTNVMQKESRSGKKLPTSVKSVKNSYVRSVLKRFIVKAIQKSDFWK